MKKVLIASFLAAIACAPASSFGQSPSPAASDAPSAAPSLPTVHQQLGASPLTPEDRATLQSASQKAQQDPTVKADFKKMADAMKAAHGAMLAKDSSVGPLLDKIEAASAPGAPRPKLTPDEAMKLRAAREAIKGTPEADAWQKATTEYHDAVRQAMIAADPAVSDILMKISQSGAMHRSMVPPVPPVSSSPAASASASPK